MVVVVVAVVNFLLVGRKRAKPAVMHLLGGLQLRAERSSGTDVLDNIVCCVVTCVGNVGVGGLTCER
jgi:hypothetical protein